MLPYQFASKIFLRLPVYSLENYSAEKLQSALDSHFFRVAIYFGSRGLYKEAALRNFRCNEMSLRMQRSLLNYYNRMCYRPTPFGMFAAFACTSWGKHKGGLCIGDQHKLNVHSDFRLGAAIGRTIVNSCSHQDIYYFPNPSLYAFGKELRYMKNARTSEMSESSQGIAAVSKTGSYKANE